jgi:alkylation response protein AidB-like acyl-CoA dehydrogenase
MSTYRPPLRDMQFVLKELAGYDAIAALPGYEEAKDVADAILEEAGAFASEVLDPINVSGDREGCTWRDGVVTTPKGFKEAYKRFADAGWIGLTVPQEFGGQGLPKVLLGPTHEMWNAANVGFANGPGLNQSAIETIVLTGSDEQKHRLVPKLLTGEWTGTMNLTEPQAGSDLAAVRTRAVPEGDKYRVSGQKIFITFGEHDWAPNIIHLVLARLPDAPEGTKGISMFVVPKMLLSADGSLGERNDVQCASIEHKLGINGNPTCTLNYGEKGGALGELVGEPHRGMEYMFIMMNASRFSVGVQALGIADRAYQSALEYARVRVQGRDVKDIASRSAPPVPIIKHADVRRMLMMMKSQIEAMRALAYVTAASLDLAERHPDKKVRDEHQAFVELMTPVVKGWSTEVSIELCSTALQVFGGMGYIEETGIAQQYRDVRITAIYEGTTGIQALDLVGRKLMRDRGVTATRVITQMRQFAASLASSQNADVAAIRDRLQKGLDALTEASLAFAQKADLSFATAGSVPYLKLMGVVAAGWQMARAAQVAEAKIAAGDTDPFYKTKIATARFYADHVLTQARWLRDQIVEGAADVMSVGEDEFDLDRKMMATV